MRNNKNRPRTAEDMVHDAVKTGAHLPGVEAAAAAEQGRRSGVAFSAPTAGIADGAPADKTPVSVAGLSPADPDAKMPYQLGGRDVGAGYFSNPFDAGGRARIGKQFWHAPLGGHVRSALEGQEVFGHAITNQQARMAEQGLAGLTAVGVGVPAFLAAVNQLSTPQTPDTIPL